MKNQKFLKRLQFSLHGFKSAWQTENSFRTQVMITVIVIAVLTYLRPSLQWTAVFILVIGATLAAELLNTSLEYMIDFLHPGIHTQIGKAKDCAAAAVLVLSLSSIFIFILFLVEKFNAS
jgi:diacylglycerol kinase (ATP)